ncbi:MAG TPA: L,D-transpeptidase [Polyangiaceae bacterium]
MTRLRAPGLLASCALVASTLVQSAWADQSAWTGPDTPPLPSEFRSVEILRADEPLFQRPEADAPRRGTAALGARLPLFEATLGSGCGGRWLSVGPMAWVCESVVQLSSQPPLAAETRVPPPPDGLPYRYYFVGPNGSLGYRELGSAEQGAPDAELEPEFVVAVSEVRQRPAGDPFGLTTHALWLPMRDLSPAQPTAFRGAEPPTATQAWVITDAARAFAKPGGRVLPARFARLTRVERLERRETRGQVWFRVGQDQWLSDRDLTYATDAPLPAELRPHERWIDVDLERQVLTAYAGAEPVLTTLISSGRGSGAAENATPTGEHRIWVKLRASDMDNLENPEASRYYAIQSVPWVMYFKQGYGLHGAFWHHDFGRVRSHGCVNLSPLDAHRLFHWTSPRVPAGWTAVFPTDYERGTLVRVR